MQIRRRDRLPSHVLMLGLLVMLARASDFPAMAGEADVLAVEVAKTSSGATVFIVTVRHEDVGWDHYADRWEILGPDGTILATRVLRHPHVEEQPLTRSLRVFAIPEGITRVRVRAHDKVHGFGGLEKEVALPN